METPAAAEMKQVNWRTVAVLAVLALAVWWVWRRRSVTQPAVPMQANATPAPQTPSGIPVTLTDKIARVVDTAIPVVMTSGSAVPYDEDEINQIVRRVLTDLNSMGEAVSLIKVVSSSKTQDSYKTVAYDIVFNAYDATANVGVMLSLSVLVPVSGKMFVRKFALYNTPESLGAGPRSASEPAGYVAYEDPVQVLSKMKIT